LDCVSFGFLLGFFLLESYTNQKTIGEGEKSWKGVLPSRQMTLRMDHITGERRRKKEKTINKSIDISKKLLSLLLLAFSRCRRLHSIGLRPLFCIIWSVSNICRRGGEERGCEERGGFTFSVRVGTSTEKMGKQMSRNSIYFPNP
jgi:hypothetical protein